MKDLPTVSVVIVTYNGRDLLRGCLDSLGGVDYPRDLLDVVIVDNGSDDGTAEWVAKDYPGARLIRLEQNLGFAEPNNIGARQATGEWLALLNNDMKVHKDWLRKMVEVAFSEVGTACVGGRVLSWDGREVDFGGGAINFEGRGFQIGFREGSDETASDGEEIPFANGGSMLVLRELFLDVGGFDPDYFAYYEDVDLGWRLWLYGHRVVFAKSSIAYHRHGATSRGIPEFKKRFLRQRNSLFTILKNYGEGTLSPALASTLLLTVRRAMRFGEGNPPEFHILQGAKGLDFDSGTDAMDRDGSAELAAIQAVCRVLPALVEKRREVQGRRQIPDPEVFSRFGDPFRAIVDDRDYRGAQKKTLSLLGMSRRFAEGARGKILFVTRSIFGDRMSGPDVRFLEMARALGTEFDVTITTPYRVEGRPEGVEVIQVEDDEALVPEMAGARAILTSGFVLDKYPSLCRSSVPLVVDLYCPFVLENLEFHRRQTEGRVHQRAAHDHSLRVLMEQVEVGDFFLCASQREADFLLGAMMAAGRINPDTYAVDRTLSNLLGVVPFGIPGEEPERRHRAIREAYPRIGPEDKVLLWGGGIQPWMDARTLIAAMGSLRKRREDVHLVFLGAKHPSPEVPETGVLQDCVALAQEMGLHGDGVYFHEWVPYEERQDFLLDADIGVSAHPETIEARFSFRTRIVDYLWAALPLVSAGRDPLSAEVEASGAAVVTPSGDPEALTKALGDLLDSPEKLAAMGKAARELSGRYHWEKVTEPLRTFCREPRFARDRIGGSPVGKRGGAGMDSTLREILNLVETKGAEKRALAEKVDTLSRELQLATPLVDRVMDSAPFRLYDWASRRIRKTPGPETIPIRGKRNATQTFRADRAGLRAVAVRMATYSRRNTQAVIWTLRRGTEEVASGKVNASAFRDGKEHSFTFDPVEDSREGRFTLSLESPDSHLGDFPGCHLRDGDLEYRLIYR